MRRSRLTAIALKDILNRNEPSSAIMAPLGLILRPRDREVALHPS
jgi:hypothetical protein